MSIASGCLAFSGLYEAELLTELMLRYWQHPLAGNEEYRHDILEAAANALRASVDGTRLIEELDPANMNFVAALWFAEWVAVESLTEGESADREGRQRWLDAVRRAVPSCFCDQRLLP